MAVRDGGDRACLRLTKWRSCGAHHKVVEGLVKAAEQQLLSNKMLLLDPGINLLPVVGEMM